MHQKTFKSRTTFPLQISLTLLQRNPHQTASMPKNVHTERIILHELFSTTPKVFYKKNLLLPKNRFHQNNSGQRALAPKCFNIKHEQPSQINQQKTGVQQDWA